MVAVARRSLPETLVRKSLTVATKLAVSVHCAWPAQDGVPARRRSRPGTATQRLTGTTARRAARAAFWMSPGRALPEQWGLFVAGSDFEVPCAAPQTIVESHSHRHRAAQGAAGRMRRPGAGARMPRQLTASQSHMYINFWYPICTTTELTAASPVKARVLTLPFVAFRDADGKAHVLSDTCVHRGGALHKGKLVDGRLACPYHGWQFDGAGRCARIPSLGAEGYIPARAKVDSYPVIERYGIVFAFLGDLSETERPALYDGAGVRPAGLARRPGDLRRQCLLRALHRERPRPGAQRVRAHPAGEHPLPSRTACTSPPTSGAARSS